MGILLRSGYLIEILLAVEVMLGGLVLAFIGVSVEIDDVGGVVLGLVILVVAAAESCVGLGILVSYYGLAGSVSSRGLRLIRS